MSIATWCIAQEHSYELTMNIFLTHYAKCFDLILDTSENRPIVFSAVSSEVKKLSTVFWLEIETVIHHVILILLLCCEYINNIYTVSQKTSHL